MPGMPDSDLPPGFAWRPWINADEWALTFRGQNVGLVTLVPTGRVRVTRGVDRPHMRVTFASDVDAGRRFLEAWARRWEAEIRKSYL